MAFMGSKETHDDIHDEKKNEFQKKIFFFIFCLPDPQTPPLRHPISPSRGEILHCDHNL